MSLYGLRRSLFARWPGMLVLWLLAWSVGAAYACSPPLEAGEQAHQAILAAAHGPPSLHPESCDDLSPGITASLGKMPADDSRQLTAAAGLPSGLHALSLFPYAVGGAQVLSGLSPYSLTPAYLATARLRI